MVKVLTYDEMIMDTFSSGVSVLMFYLPNCGPCESFYPTFESLSEKFPETNFFKLVYDADEPNFVDLAERFNVVGYPKVAFIVDGDYVLSMSNSFDFEHALESLVTYFQK